MKVLQKMYFQTHTKYPCLTQKSNGYYIRFAIPKRMWIFSKCKELSYSLNTADFHIAIMRWKRELAHIQLFLDTFEEVCMKINANGTVTLTPTDVDKVLLYRLERIQYFTEENAGDIMDGVATYDDIKLYDKEDKKDNPDKIKQLMCNLIVEYIENLIQNRDANSTIKTVYELLKNKEVEFGYNEYTTAGYDWMKSLSNHLGCLERYAEKSINAIKEDEAYSTSNPKVLSLLRTYDEKKTRERLESSLSKTSWDKLFKKYWRNKQNVKGVKNSLEDINKRSIFIAFTLMGKKYVEDIKEQDCRKLCEEIYRLPKNWNGILKENQTISNILTNGKNVISKATVKKYLTTFKEFMRFAVREQVIKNSFNEITDIPLHIEYNNRQPFTTKELKLIFNPEQYIDPRDKKYQAHWWIPLIALYQGCRINEISQLDMSDIKIEKGIYYMSINDDGVNKSLKNKASKRIIPIHPKLEELGFIKYIHYQQDHKEKKLFSTLKPTKDLRWGKSVENWFSKYLDKLNIKSGDKTFHSFRHTFESKAVEKKLHTEHQNALGGWSQAGIGQKVYGSHFEIKTLYEELSKIEYPIDKELKGLKELYDNCYVMRYFQKK